ncbi:acetyl/propionyl/methylcrotonyl-CoA carboxylase subunit alpha [Rhizobium sp. Root1220]|uniref:acetyl/propionyl/methylcrotonyl-CoA carboxylase subunit alpha n=1 Tax=Rhizobium sp. Root1220 TaxID=1736432 RepID=UPI0006F81B9E|nr:acetyl/propionyl/methylcrotonyl-CoA carboxylase subunit alpha [Rhizobium sp. Root1220]KQV72994.1 3-methylcrotonyl-CoA carboxylase [Rhizobium sp. Root1220]
MFHKILIANRGEIACRIIRTAKRMGISTVAVYSDTDVAALHVELADEAVRLGSASARESYLSIERIIAAAHRTGAEAIHPGYGFLSENADFAEAVEAAGLVFIGPQPSSIRAMGLKDAAKALMDQSGVPVVPGYHGEEQDNGFLADQAVLIGYPVLIKARAGGGGKGMRRVDHEDDFPQALEAARREAMAAFGDDAVLIERCLIRPRHIEVQIFGDRHGNVVHLFERDCSLQRRHQKVIEEAPAPGMTPEMRRVMGDAAVRAARAIGYRGAGTVEFIADVSNGLWPDRFYFMEMNTRLQVEHPVTEAISGVDLVEWQLRVAAGEPLPKKQSELEIYGWAFEARIYAEDASTGFLPATGTIRQLSFPDVTARVDAGVRSGDVISAHYDPLIAKMIVHGPNRTVALARLTRALQASHIVGVTTNLDFLARLSAEAEFVAGHPDTGLIERNLQALTAVEPPTDTTIALAAVLSLGTLAPLQGGNPWDALGHWQLWSEMQRIVTLSHKGGHASLRIAARGFDFFAVHDGRRVIPVKIVSRAAEGCRAEVDGRQIEVMASLSAHQLVLGMDSKSHVFHLANPLDAETGKAAAGNTLIAPMPGFVKIVHTRQGSEVAKDEPLLVMEAMKMELTLVAPRGGTIEAVQVSEGQQVDEGAVLLTLQEEEK